MKALLASVMAAGLLVGTATVAGAADETYALKTYKSKKGDKVERVGGMETKGTIAIEGGGATSQTEITTGKKEAYTEEILEQDGNKSATKLKRTYTVAEKTAKGETTKTAYAGKTVLIEKKEDGYEFSIDGKALTEDEAPELFKSYNGGTEDKPGTGDLLPEAPVRVGERWTVPAGASERMFKSIGEESFRLDLKKSTIEGALLKVYKKDGAQFGVLEFTVTLFVTEVNFDGELAKVSADSKMVMKITLDTCIDGTNEFEDAKMEMTIDVVVEVPGGGSIAIRGTTIGTEKTMAVKE
ncbi:MAG: hypothetical protein J0I06_18040 [Planctomycetes bacterium]|nr:hypothetical protein [Planctomycetota bacterium]